MDRHLFNRRHLQTKRFGGDCWFWSPLHVLTCCFRILLKHPKLIYSNDATGKVWNGLRGVDGTFASCDWALAHFTQTFVRNVTNLNVPLAIFLNITFSGQTLASSSRIRAVSSDFEHVTPTHVLVHLSGSSSSVTCAGGLLRMDWLISKFLFSSCWRHLLTQYCAGDKIEKILCGW